MYQAKCCWVFHGHGTSSLQKMMFAKAPPWTPSTTTARAKRRAVGFSFSSPLKATKSSAAAEARAPVERWLQREKS